MKRKQLLKKRNQNVLSPIFERLEEMILMTAVPGGTPEYYGENGVGNWAFSPQPDPTTGTGGILKFQDSLPGLGAAMPIISGSICLWLLRIRRLIQGLTITKSP